MIYSILTERNRKISNKNCASAAHTNIAQNCLDTFTLSCFFFFCRLRAMNWRILWKRFCLYGDVNQSYDRYVVQALHCCWKWLAAISIVIDYDNVPLIHRRSQNVCLNESRRDLELFNCGLGMVNWVSDTYSLRLTH